MPIVSREMPRPRLLSLLKNYSVEHKEHYEFNRQAYFTSLQNSSAKINELTIKSHYHPMILSHHEYEWIKDKTEYMWGILEKTAHLLRTKPDVAAFFGFSDTLTKLLAMDPGYPIQIPITRFDAFYTAPSSLKFCEFNTDGTSGMNETNTIEEAFLTTPFGQYLKQEFSLEQLELRKSLLATLLDCYHSFRGERHNPHIAIVDFMDKATHAEFEALRDTFIQEGYATIICDPEDLVFRNNRLYRGKEPIDLVYRRAVTTELLERVDRIRPFLEAYRQGAFCMVGSFRSEAAHSKLVFTFLTDPRAQAYFTQSETDFIRTHLPQTFALTKELLSEYEPLLTEKDRYLIKPHNAYGSQGLSMGKDCDQGTWNELVQRHADTNYIVQERIAIPEEPFLIDANETQTLKVNLSPFLYGGKLAGFYTRVSDIEIITTSRGGALLPTFIAQEK